MDWQEIFAGHLDATFALEVLLRTVVMFAAVLVTLRLSGKKGVRQLSIFDLAIVIAMGSAAGDPMFNEDEPIGPALIVAVTILVLYRGITWLASKSRRFERLIEGEPMCVVEHGRFALPGGEPGYAQDEFFAEMRQQGIEHVGQVRIAVLETSGALSCFFYEDGDVQPGLPILPGPYGQRSRHIATAGPYACTFCASVEELQPSVATCKRCKGTEWVAAVRTLRVR